MRFTPILLSAVLSSQAHGYWREACSPPGTTATTCDVAGDGSSYHSPRMYYQSANGSYQVVKNNGTTVAYYGHGENAGHIQPFPMGLRMISGNSSARTYDKLSKPFKGTLPIADRVTFTCLGTLSTSATHGLEITECEKGLLAQIQFQSCWNGKDLYLGDNSHVAYSSGIESGNCPQTHPIQFVHLAIEVLYSLESIKQDGGRFVFANDDDTGFGFTGEFINAWEPQVQTDAIKYCAIDNISGGIDSCAPLFESNGHHSDIYVGATADKQIEELRKRHQLSDTSLNTVVTSCTKTDPSHQTAASGTFSNSGPTAATAPTTLQTLKATPVPAIEKTAESPGEVSAPAESAKILSFFRSFVYNGCWSEGIKGLPLPDGQWTTDDGMTVEACLNHCTGEGFGLAGLQYGQVCFCGAEISNGATLVDDNQCGIPCQGDKGEVCGGEGRLSVYASG